MACQTGQQRQSRNAESGCGQKSEPPMVGGLGLRDGVSVMSDITDRLQECADHFPVIEDNPYSVFVDAKNEITSLRQQLTQAKARVAELEAGYTKLCNSASLTRKILQDSARRSGITDVAAHANWGHLDTSEHESTITKANAFPWLLREQAEAVEDVYEGAAGFETDQDGDGFVWARDIKNYAQRLRQQADEAEKDAQK